MPPRDQPVRSGRPANQFLRASQESGRAIEVPDQAPPNEGMDDNTSGQGKRAFVQPGGRVIVARANALVVSILAFISFTFCLFS
jgi:hypothetical protein